MNTFREIARVVAIFLGLCCAVITSLFLLGFWTASWHKSRTFTYPALSNVFERRAVHLGWMPDFLPPSTRNIREQRNGEEGTSIVAFEFDPADFELFSARFAAVPSKRFRGIRPGRIHKQEPWFPAAILKGQLHELVDQGFTIYQTEIEYSRTGKSKKRWFAAINPQKGVCYLWRRYVQE